MAAQPLRYSYKPKQGNEPAQFNVSAFQGAEYNLPGFQEVDLAKAQELLRQKDQLGLTFGSQGVRSFVANPFGKGYYIGPSDDELIQQILGAQAPLPSTVQTVTDDFGQQVQMDAGQLENMRLAKEAGFVQVPGKIGEWVPAGTPSPEEANAAFQATQPKPTYQSYNPRTGQITYGTPTSAGMTAGAPTTAQQVNLYSGAASYAGPSIIDFLKTAGQPSDRQSIINLMTQYGVINSPSEWRGSASQNTQLLNILKGIAKGETSQLGIPSTISSTGPSIPSVTSPISTSALGGQFTDLSKILGANTPININGDIAGLLSLYGETTKSQKDYEDLQSKLTTILSSLDDQALDLQTELEKQGVTAAFNQVKELNLKAAQLKGELEQFDVETEKEQLKIKDQSIPTGLILGQQRQYFEQRQLEKIGKAAEMSATIALSQAYQGNAQLGIELAKSAVDLKYAPILNKIEVLKTQLGFAKEKLSKEDTVRTNIINKLISLKENEIEVAKNNQKQVQGIAIEAAINGAPLSVVNAIRNAPDPVTAAQLGAKYLTGKITIPQSSIAQGQSVLDASRGQPYVNEKGQTITPPASDKYANTAIYLQMLASWKADGGIEQDFFKHYPPKLYLNPNDPTVPQYVRDMLKKPSSGEEPLF